MKKLMTFLTIGATVAILALPVAAQDPKAATDPCSEDGKLAMYTKFREIYKNDQAQAYDLAKKYLACPVATPTEAQQKIIDFLKKWSTAYETGMRPIRLRQLLYTDKKYAEAFALGKEILATEPENMKVLVDLGANGYLVAPLNNPQLTADSLEYAKKALQLLESGKTVEDWQELQSKDIAVAYLNYTVGALTVEKDPGAALKYLIKAAQFETPLKKSPYTYAYIAGAYETGPYAKQSEEYKRLFGGKDETPESKLALANINQLVDRMIDGYARAVALAGTDSKFATQKPVWTESLTTWYKFRNNQQTAGMDTLVAGILSKPLPPEPTPLTSLPPSSTPAATPTGTSGTPTNGAASGTTPGTGTGNGATKTATTTTPAAASTKPTANKPGTNPNRPRNR
jgi:tetratricopeptide (TPR) repeat protein